MPVWRVCSSPTGWPPSKSTNRAAGARKFGEFSRLPHGGDSDEIPQRQNVYGTLIAPRTLRQPGLMIILFSNEKKTR